MMKTTCHMCEENSVSVNARYVLDTNGSGFICDDCADKLYISKPLQADRIAKWGGKTWESLEVESTTVDTILTRGR